MAALSNGDLVTATAISQIDSTGVFTDSITVGTGGATDKSIIFDIGQTTSNPAVNYDSANNRMNLNIGTAIELRVSMTTGTTYLLKFDTDGELTITGALKDNQDIT